MGGRQPERMWRRGGGGEGGGGEGRDGRRSNSGGVEGGGDDGGGHGARDYDCVHDARRAGTARTPRSGDGSSGDGSSVDGGSVGGGLVGHRVMRLPHSKITEAITGAVTGR